MANLHHAINYIEFNVADLPVTKAFYETAFGWRFNDYGPEYAGIVAPDGEGEVGGMNATGAGRGAGRAGALVLLYSDDLDATLSAVRSAGGEIVEDPYEFPGGRRFHFTDPSGNELGVWSTS
jgi:uncharacterized protein